MKSFGARLALGAVTILLGAFGVVQAQKDREDSTEDAWTAQAPPSLGGPPAPIGGEADDSWLTPPGTAEISSAETPNSGPSNALAQAAQALTKSSGVQLVQHTEPVVDQVEVDAPADAPMVLPTFNPEASPTEAPSDTAADGPGFGLPGSAAPAVGENESAPALTIPAIPTAEDIADVPAEMPEVNLATVPTGDLLGSGTADAPAVNSNPLAIPDTIGGVVEDAAVAGAAVAGAAAVVATADEPSFPNTLRGEVDAANPMRPEQTPPNEPGFAGVDPLAGAVAGQTGSEAAVALQDAPAGFGAPIPGLGEANLQAETAQPLALETLAAEGPSGALGQPSALGNPVANPLAGNEQLSGTGQPTNSAFNTPASLPNQAGGAAAPFPAGQAAQPLQQQPGAGYDPRAGASGVIAAQAAPEARVASLPGQGGALPNYGAEQNYGAQPGFQQPPPVGAVGAVDPNLTANAPGDRRLEGVQSPSIVIQKRAPGEVKVGKPASFVIHVQNVGTVDALDVRVHDRIPQGMRLIDASPAPVMQGDMLLWQLGVMPAGDERTVTMQLVPEQEGELGSVARVTFEAAASVRTMSTRPELKIVQRAPETVLIGQQLEIQLEVSNPGTGEAVGVVLQEDVPEGLEHPKGRQLDNMIGTLAPNEVRRQVLRLRAVAPGMIQNEIRLTGEDGLTAVDTISVEVVAPKLSVNLEGPSKRSLERQATYQVQIANVGTAPATNVEIVAQLDRGFSFVSTDFEGQYDPSRHAVIWSLASLPQGEKGSVPLTLLPVEVGNRAINLQARADLVDVVKSEHNVTIDAFAKLTFQISNPGGPIEIGSDTIYEVNVKNIGTAKDTNVVVQLQLPPGLELVSTDGQASSNGSGLVAFQPQPQLAAGGDFKYRLRVRAVAPGTHLVKAIVTSDQSSVPVTKEESTMVYADQ